jgi:hypothetical protein
MNELYQMLLVEEKLRGHPQWKPLHTKIVDTINKMVADMAKPVAKPVEDDDTTSAPIARKV